MAMKSGWQKPASNDVILDIWRVRTLISYPVSELLLLKESGQSQEESLVADNH